MLTYIIRSLIRTNSYSGRQTRSYLYASCAFMKIYCHGISFLISSIGKCSFFFYLDFTARKDYFTNFEPSQP